MKYTIKYQDIDGKRVEKQIIAESEANARLKAWELPKFRMIISLTQIPSKVKFPADKIWDILYPLFAKDIMYNEYETAIKIIKQCFELTPEQEKAIKKGHSMLHKSLIV